MSTTTASDLLARGFERFDRTQMGTPLRPELLTVTAGGLLSLSEAAYVALGRPACVVLYRDRETREIAISPHIGAGLTTYLVRRSSRRWVVSASAFCKAVGIYGAVRSFAATIEDGILFAETKQGP